MALKRLHLEYKTLKKDPNYLYSIEPSEESFLTWNFIMIGPSDTLYEGGLFHGVMNFTEKYPIEPPKVIFKNMIHPNVYKSGEVCISILHYGVDVYGYEKDYERWSPSHGIDSIMMSIISMLSEPNIESPANTDISILCKNSPEQYRRMIYDLVYLSQK
jgi:ubiquitin-protein ligase